MNRDSLNVIIPSRHHAQQARFLERAIGSIRAQSIIDRFDVTILIAIDRGAPRPADIAALPGVRFVESAGASQAAALNAAIPQASSSYVAFLEDDDQWRPRYLEIAFPILKDAQFVSCNQVEFDENDLLLRVNDFATPSGWLMPKATLDRVGLFNEDYRFHIDNEWLGRLTETGLQRAHLVECTAPHSEELIRITRPILAFFIDHSGGSGRVTIIRHPLPMPQVVRLRHSASALTRTETDPALAQVSQKEYDRLIARFGLVPW